MIRDTRVVVTDWCKQISGRQRSSTFCPNIFTWITHRKRKLSKSRKKL